MNNESWVWRALPNGSIAISEVGEPISGGRVATVPYKCGFEDRTKRRASLIAAAPDLYRELENISKAATIDWDDPLEFEAWAKSRARFAMARARGEDFAKSRAEERGEA